MRLEVVAAALLCAGCPPPPDPGANDLTLSPGNAEGQDEDPALLRASDGRFYAAWYSNRNGKQADGLEDKEIFLSSSADGETWSDPPIQLTRHARFAFAPSLAQDDAGAFHLAYWRVIPTPDGCVPGVNCNGGTNNRIFYKSSPNGVDWNLDAETSIAGGPGDWLPSIAHDRVGRRRLIYWASPTRDASGHTDLAQRTLRIYVSINPGTGWSFPQRVTGEVNQDATHNTYPFVVQRADGQLVMTWTRYAATAPSDPLQVIRERTTETMVATSMDGVSWTGAAAVTSNTEVDVFPSLYLDPAGAGWNVLWLSGAGGTGATVEAPAAGPYDTTARPEIHGYTARVVPTATAGTFLAAWVNGPDGRQKIRRGFFSR